MNTKININNVKYRYITSSVLAFSIPLILYILTLQPKIIGGESSWYALNIPGMVVLPPPGYPVYSLLAKLFTLIPVGDLAYKLNLFSAIFGAFTILLLFFTIYFLVKDEIISLTISLTLAFIIFIILFVISLYFFFVRFFHILYSYILYDILYHKEH